MKIEEQEHRIQDLEAANQQLQKIEEQQHRIQDLEAVNQQLQMKIEHGIQDLEAVNKQLQLKTEEQERRIQDLEYSQLKTGKDKEKVQYYFCSYVFHSISGAEWLSSNNFFVASTQVFGSNARWIVAIFHGFIFSLPWCSQNFLLEYFVKNVHPTTQE